MTRTGKLYACTRQLKGCAVVMEVTGERPPVCHDYLKPADPDTHGGYAVFNILGIVGPFLWYENALATRAKVGGRVVRWKDFKELKAS